MIVIYNNLKQPICARCGIVCDITKDHFIPKSSKWNPNKEDNYVGICLNCNREKANKIVLPTWYKYISQQHINYLNRVMRYSAGYIESVCTDEEILEYVKVLKKEFMEELIKEHGIESIWIHEIEKEDKPINKTIKIKRFIQ